MKDTSPLALVTGASSGVGFELAKLLAENGYALLLAAADDELRRAADEIRAMGAHADAVQVDLSAPGGVGLLYERLTALGRPVAVAVLNAGVGGGGPFVRTGLADEIRLVDLNIISTVALAKRLLPEMAARREGRVLFTSQLAPTVPASHQAVRLASMSFARSFAEALGDELRDAGVTVTALMPSPGPTGTELSGNTGTADARIGQEKESDPVRMAKDGFEALMNGQRPVVVGSPRTKADLAATVLPDTVLTDDAPPAHPGTPC
ncbi:SDR family NAD(P)-dependent oxidoreductase [Streptomyces sp. NBC_01498]|uniref:SDR family NAD(P)-dependent oxidoreductase n=1 Tax=Streptomyces sp. NBC_01498 TaxID=2975870 RepID=UPI002E7C37CD|nr:SDR family NAD(P)-dependent oxidoreductase [Streptomyces sp. NBC_01498]WTL24131.1 SDR family NAD(P)-dependent oxidoreductase [Streptomyces sp. NBC_01498]